MLSSIRERKSKMLPIIIICTATCLLMITAVLFFPKLRLGKIFVDTYWIITIIGAIVAIAFRQTSLSAVTAFLVADTPVNPLKILVLFISMTLLSVFLDELGFFGYLASVTLRRAGRSQKRLFFLLYVIVASLTVFTSNDIIILSFTPFICYFAKAAKINPMPYVATEFVAANTWSMALIIGNPTNIYLATFASESFWNYLQVMILPTVMAGLVSLLLLYLLFRRSLSAPIEASAQIVELKDKLLLVVGIVHLAVCTILLAIGPYLGLEMWLVASLSTLSLCVFNLVIGAIRKRPPTALGKSLVRAPWQLVPFVLSMFVLIFALDGKGATQAIASAFSHTPTILTYGLGSFLVSNLVNNIPMSVLFSSIISNLPRSVATGALYATVIGSNLGACLTPVGALAGIMWSNILKKHGLEFSYVSFVKVGVIVALPTLLVALLGLWLVLG